MALYYLAEGDVVTDLISPPDGNGLNDVEGLTPEQIAAAVLVPEGALVCAGMRVPAGGFVASPNALRSPAGNVNTPVELTPAQRAQVLLSTGLTVTSTSGDWTATFAVLTDPTGHSVWSMVMAEQLSLLVSGGLRFANGQQTLQWPDVTSTPAAPSLRTLNATQAQAFFTAIGEFVAQCRDVINGVPDALPPPAEVTIP